MFARVARSAALPLCACLLASAAPAAAVPPDFQSRADAILSGSYPDKGPGAAVIVTEGGKTVYARGRGLADIEAGRPITPDTVFRLGSITKQFASAVLLQLIDEGKLSLDDPLSKFLPDYPQPGASATVRQLLNHTSGVQSYTGIPGWMEEKNTARAVTTDQLIAVFKDMPSPSKPGEEWNYNNSGYVLVGAIVEKVTGKPWHQVVEERIAAPLKLATIRYGVGEESIAAMARGYTDGDKGPAPAKKIHMSVPHAAGGLVGSVTDLATWANALHRGKVVSAASYAAMTAPTKMPDGKIEKYGFGLGIDDVRGRRSVGHGGGIFGFSTSSLYVPEKDLFVAVFTNSDDPATPPDVAALKLAALALGDPFAEFSKVDVDVKALEPLFGVYKIEKGDAQRRFYERDGQLYTLRSGGRESKVYAAGANRFFYGPNSLNWFEIKRNAAGVPVMEMHQNGSNEAELALRSGPIPPEAAAVEVPRATLERYVGEYVARAGTATIALADDGQLTIKLGRQQAIPLRAASATEFRPQGVDARVVFKLEQDKVTGLSFHQGERTIEAQRKGAD